MSVTGDANLYDNYVGYWNRMKENSWTDGGDTWSGTERGRDGSVPGTKSYFYPRTQTDPVAGTLKKLSCVNDGRVWVAASLFHSDERIPVRDPLIRLNNAGCDVRVIVASSDDKNWAMTASGLGDAEVNILNGVDAAWESYHNKLIVTDAHYEGAPRTTVYAGSHNLNHGSLRESSDGMLRMTNSGVFDVYADNYAYMWELSKAH